MVAKGGHHSRGGRERQVLFSTINAMFTPVQISPFAAWALVVAPMVHPIPNAESHSRLTMPSLGALNLSPPMATSMKPLRSAVFILLFLFAAMSRNEARAIRLPSDEELFAQSDLVVIATPVATHDTAEHVTDAFGFKGQSVIGVETRFAVTKVLKGDRSTKELTLFHYRFDNGAVINAPMLIEFDVKQKRAFRLFLVRLPDGQYAPTAGQMDAWLSVKAQG
jgi:hypothetical protein